MFDNLAALLESGWLVALIVAMGAVVAAIAQILSTYRQAQSNHQIELSKLSIELARKDYEDEVARNPEASIQEIRPMSSYVWFHYRFLRLIDKDQVEPNDIESFLKDYETVLRAYKEADIHKYNPQDFPKELPEDTRHEGR